MLAACEAALAGAKCGRRRRVARCRAFAACPANSIDYAVMEKLADTFARHRRSGGAADAGWSDIGAWGMMLLAIAARMMNMATPPSSARRSLKPRTTPTFAPRAPNAPVTLRGD